MLKQIEGSKGVAEAVALCRPEVICAYPITPQTHIVEGLGELVKSGHLKGCEYINVESEFAAMSVAIGASAAGARAYTATSSQGLLFMIEAVYNASGMGLPIVMTLGNRSVGAPLNIWNDHADAMCARDTGWIQLFAESNQEAVDLHIQAFKLAEKLSAPVMVCVDGFILTHAYEGIDVPDQKLVDKFLPPFEPIQWLDPKDPVSMGATVGPDAFTEVRYLEHHKQLKALDFIPEIFAEFEEIFGRVAGGLVRSYRLDDAETAIVAMGSVVGTLKDVVDVLREKGEKIGVLSICAFRPFPEQAVRKALNKAKRIIVLEKAIGAGQGGYLLPQIRLSLEAPVPMYNVIAGLGGRPILKKSLFEYLAHMDEREPGDLHFLDLKTKVVDPELARMMARWENDDVAEDKLKDVA